MNALGIWRRESTGQRLTMVSNDTRDDTGEGSAPAEAVSKEEKILAARIGGEDRHTD